jgi:shikimate dehydrogenase
VSVPYAEVIGDPIAHSKSPLIHRFWLEKLGIPGDYRRSRVSQADLWAYLAERRADPDWRGCNVTAPLKQEAVAFVGHLSPEAGRAGAVNTIVPREDGSRVGANKDVLAIADLLRKAPIADYPNRIATYVQIIGAGGAALAAVVGAADAGYGNFEIFNRTPERALSMTSKLSLPPWFAGDLSNIGPLRNPDEYPADQAFSHVVINASSLGMLGNPEVPIDLARYFEDTVVIDMAYKAEGTTLIEQARHYGLRAFDGFDVLIRQARYAFRLFFGIEAPSEHDAELRELLTQ